MATAQAWQGAESTVKYAVHLGVWTNWSRGAIMGATLTLRRTEGNYLLAFTSLFITIVSGCFWSIVRRVLHRCYSTSAPRDALHHQQQAVFRNSSSAFESFQILCSLAWVWRHMVKGKHCLLRLIPGILAAVFVVVAFGIASGFSSQISSAIGTQVRVDGTNCSLVNGAVDIPDYDPYSLYPYTAQIVSNYANYAQQCYSTRSSSGIFDCTSFVRAKLRSAVDTQASCPFTNSLCRSDNANIRLDSGYIDSHKDLGINAPENERILFKAVLSCAPLSTEGFSASITTETGNYSIYNYGKRTGGQNYTYKVRSLQDQYPADNARGGRGTTFLLASFIQQQLNGSTYVPASSFQPAPGLFPQDGDVHLIFLSGNGVKFEEPVTDMWYSATNSTSRFISSGEEDPSSGFPAYQPDEAASPMACLQQFQFCDASKTRCGPLSSWGDAQIGAGDLFGLNMLTDGPGSTLENDRASRFYWLVSLFSYSVPGLGNVLLRLGASSLASTRKLYAGLMGPLPNDQWQSDVMQWWATYLAGIQGGVVSAAVGPDDPSVDHLRIKPYNKWIQDKFCDNQVILSSDYTSFSMFGLYFTYICGILIIIVAFSLDPVLDLLSDRFHRGAYSYLEWASTETLQLQRMAFQGAKSGTWSESASSIPVTSQAGEIMANLPFEYPIGQVCSEKPASNVTMTATAGTPVPMSSLKTSVAPSKSDEKLKSSSRSGTVSTMGTEVSPLTPTITVATSTKA